MKTTIESLQTSIANMVDNLKFLDESIASQEEQLALSRKNRRDLADRIDDAEQSVAVLEEATR